VVKVPENMKSMTTSHVLICSRRTLLRRLGAAGALIMMRPGAAWSTPEAVQKAIRERIGERQPQPKVAETGNSVPLTVTVESPMTPEEHVLRIHVFVPGNPLPVAATYHLGVRTGKAEVSTRIRLARTQVVLALAEMNDGSVRSATASVVVTLGACVEEFWSH
jgi:sulfur-oxidizing protein SoxY